MPLEGFFPMFAHTTLVKPWAETEYFQ